MSVSTTVAHGPRLMPRDLPRTPQLATARLARSAQAPRPLPFHMARSGGGSFPCSEERTRRELLTTTRHPPRDLCQVPDAGGWSCLPPSRGSWGMSEMPWACLLAPAMMPTERQGRTRGSEVAGTPAVISPPATAGPPTATAPQQPRVPRSHRAPSSQESSGAKGHPTAAAPQQPRVPHDHGPRSGRGRRPEQVCPSAAAVAASAAAPSRGAARRRRGGSAAMAAAAGSLVAAVLAHSGRLDKEDLGTRIGRLSRRVEELKAGPGTGRGQGENRGGGGRELPGWWRGRRRCGLPPPGRRSLALLCGGGGGSGREGANRRPVLRGTARGRVCGRCSPERRRLCGPSSSGRSLQHD